uniref:Uncharacterized protein n=1 Tax=Picea glauca TaxID=3330 RepID=A0A101M1G3_PICGL|nr:hypothetical protein ABT39_MTgene3728 [Picea glauca]
MFTFPIPIEPLTHPVFLLWLRSPARLFPSLRSGWLYPSPRFASFPFGRELIPPEPTSPYGFSQGMDPIPVLPKRSNSSPLSGFCPYQAAFTPEGKEKTLPSNTP